MEEAGRDGEDLVLVVRKAGFGLPTACPVCLPAYIYLRFANIAFSTHYNVVSPDSEDLPSVEIGNMAGFNSEPGGIFDFLKKEKIADLDSEISSDCDFWAFKALMSSWLDDATLYELWVNPNESVASKIYFLDLPWPIGKILYWKQRRAAMKRLGLTVDDNQAKEDELYRKADDAYKSLSLKLGDQKFFFENKCTSLDASFLGHALFVLQTLDDSSKLKQELIKHENLIRYAENLKTEFLDASSSSTLPRTAPHFASSSRTDKSHSSSRGTKHKSPKEKDTKPKTEEEKTFRRRAKYFLITQFIAVLVFLSLMSSTSVEEVEMEDPDGLIVED